MTTSKKNFPDDIEEMLVYVQEHPSDKDAWKELGNKYEAVGNHARAAYCRLYSGEPPKPAKSIEKTESPPSRETSYLKPLVMILSGLILGLIVLILALYKPPIEESQVSPLQITEGTKMVYAPFKSPSELKYEFELNKDLNKDSIKNTLYFKGFKDYPGLTALTPEMLSLAVENGGIVSYTDPKNCTCKIDEQPIVKLSMYPWVEDFEQLSVVYSAIASYTKENKSLPETVEVLSLDYPNNIISGHTPRMKQAFELGKKLYVSNSKQDNPSNESDTTEQPTTDSKSVDMGQQGLKQLEIVVDTKSHRLALMSGNIILRSYPVGVGKPTTPTPLKTFEITEKVKNPNNKSDGDFGSRGMTLSDTMYAIHGTNEPDSIGKDGSHGCIRMLNEDVEELFNMTPKGTKVIIQEGGLPPEIVKGKTPFELPSNSKEENPNKKYRWL